MEARQGATSGWTLRIVAYARGIRVLLCSVSVYANARFGSTLGTGAAILKRSADRLTTM